MPATPSPATVCINLQEIWCRSVILSVSSPNEPKSRVFPPKAIQLHTTTNFKADHVDAYDSDCADQATTSAIFMASLSPARSLNDEIVPPTYDSNTLSKIVEILLWYLDSGCSKHMTGHRDKLINFVSKFIGSVRFEDLGHNLFSVGKFCDLDLEVAFRKHTCFVRNLEGVDLLSGSRGSNLYTFLMDEMMKSSPICLPKLKFTKDHLCSTCQMGKRKKVSHLPKPEPIMNEKLQMLHMDLCGPMQVESINGKRYILFIVDDYSWFTWVKFLRTKDEAPEIIIKYLKQTQVSLKATVRYLCIDNDIEFINQLLRNYTENVGITHHTSIARTPQQNGVVKRRNRTLVEAARKMLIFSKSLFFLWAEAVATACYTQHRSLIHPRYNKTSYELLRDRKQ
ncbi:retrovirus-related pol polyprotein from transposon TNT 1-94 [Tanacetum coccineum]